MAFETLDPHFDFQAWRRLQRNAEFGTYPGFESQAVRLFRGDYQLLKNKFCCTRYGLWAPNRSRLLAAAIHFRRTDERLGDASAPRSSLGGFLFDSSLDSGQISAFGERLLQATGSIEAAPFNGHLALGLSHPSPDAAPDVITFLCAPANRALDHLLEKSGLFERSRTLLALTTPITPELVAKAEAGRARVEARGFASRPLSVVRFKRDLQIYHELVSVAMAGHHGFEPLTFEEEWDVMREALAILPPRWFRFLLHGRREIGFCFAYPDYNLVLRRDRSDARNALALLTARARGRWRRARLVYSALHPDYQGQGLFKAVRHQVILEMARSGVKEFESSYVDEANANSLSNVASTGGRHSHSFYLYRSR